MKKIYTVTFHRANNYGAMLQAYALQKFLCNLNYETKILDYDNYKISDQYRIIKKDKSNFFKVIIHILPRINGFISELQRIKKFDNFRNKLFLTEKINKNLSNINDILDCDVLICGSDQVWNPNITNQLDPVYLLQIGSEKIKKISYSASCGSVTNITNKEKFKKCLDKLDRISVRENELKLFLETINIESEVVLDPTLLLTKTDWIKIIRKERIIKEKYIFTYCVGNGTTLYYNVINKLSEKYNMPIVFFDKNYIKIKKKKKSFYNAGPEEFLNLLYNAELIITTSFHGFALSAILNKQMLCILSTYPERLMTLAKKIGINDRFINNETEIDKILNKQIDWEKINKNILSEREKSKKWIIKSIED